MSSQRWPNRALGRWRSCEGGRKVVVADVGDDEMTIGEGKVRRLYSSYRGDVVDQLGTGSK